MLFPCCLVLCILAPVSYQCILDNLYTETDISDCLTDIFALLMWSANLKIWGLYSPDWNPIVVLGWGRWRSFLFAVTWTRGDDLNYDKTTMQPTKHKHLQDLSSMEYQWISLQQVIPQNPPPLWTNMNQNWPWEHLRGVHSDPANEWVKLQVKFKAWIQRLELWLREEWCPEKTFTSRYLPQPQHGGAAMMTPVHFLWEAKLSLDLRPPRKVWRRSHLSHTFLPPNKFGRGPNVFFVRNFLEGNSFAFFCCIRTKHSPKIRHAYFKSLCQTTYLQPVWSWPDKATLRAIIQHIMLSERMVTQQEEKHQSRPWELSGTNNKFDFYWCTTALWWNTLSEKCVSRLPYKAE